jgi:hypothetical protein
MAERYDALISKVRDWANKPQVATLPDTVIKDCLDYAADEAYRKLRIPPLEKTVTYTITQFDNPITDSTSVQAYSVVPIPTDLVDFVYIKTVETSTEASRVFHEHTDERTFFDIYAEKYSRYNWMRKGNDFYIHPQLPIGTILEIHYYRKLPALDTMYSVVPINYEVGVADNAQTYLDASNSTNGIPLYVTNTAAYATVAEVPSGTSYTTKYFTGKEVGNWLRDNNERLLLWGALFNIASYLNDEPMEKNYFEKFIMDIDSLNKEEKYRRARGGNVQVNFNGNDLI